MLGLIEGLGCRLLLPSLWPEVVETLLGLFSKGMNLIHEGPHEAITSPRPHFFRPSVWALDFQPLNLGETQHVDHNIAGCKTGECKRRITTHLSRKLYSEPASGGLSAEGGKPEQLAGGSVWTRPRVKNSRGTQSPGS